MNRRPFIWFLRLTPQLAVAECTLCGPLGVYHEDVMYPLLVAHLAAEHKQGAPL